VFCALLLRRDFYIRAKMPFGLGAHAATIFSPTTHSQLAFLSQNTRVLCGFCARMRLPTGRKEMDATPVWALNFTQNPSRQSVFAPALGLKLRRARKITANIRKRTFLCNFGGNSFLTRLIFAPCLVLIYFIELNNFRAQI
jgi:hypothetical protein